MDCKQRDWPGMQVQMVAVASLVPYARNAKLHPEQQVKQIAASITEWGFTIPVLIDDDQMIIAGHGRVLAANLLKLTEIPCMRASGWSDAKKRAYIIADNKLTENGGWDAELLGLELSDLIEAEFDMSLTGYPEAQEPLVLQLAIEPRWDVDPSEPYKPAPVLSPNDVGLMVGCDQLDLPRLIGTSRAVVDGVQMDFTYRIMAVDLSNLFGIMEMTTVAHGTPVIARRTVWIRAVGQ